LPFKSARGHFEVLTVTNIATQHIKISPKDELYFDAIFQYRHLLSEKSQNAMWDFGLNYLGFKPEVPQKNNGISPDIVRSERVRERLMEILQNPEANNSERCYLAGFLGCDDVGFSEEEILEIIDTHNRWSDYLPSKTQYHVRKILDKIKKGGS
jgi:hypothetical protein